MRASPGSQGPRVWLDLEDKRTPEQFQGAWHVEISLDLKLFWGLESGSLDLELCRSE